MARRITADGVNAFFFNWETRTISGWCSGLKVGYEILATMQSGKKAVFKITEIDYKLNPSDQYFAKVEDLGYLEELSK